MTMTVNQMESRLEFLKAELERELHLLRGKLTPEEVSAGCTKPDRKIVGKILLEVGALQMRLTEADRR